jgi:hypothetical protein
MTSRFPYSRRLLPLRQALRPGWVQPPAADLEGTDFAARWLNQPGVGWIMLIRAWRPASPGGHGRTTMTRR